MKENKKKEEVEKRLLATFLKTMKETIGTEGCEIDIAKEGREAGVKYYSSLPSILIDKGILKRERTIRRSGITPKCYWLTTTDPNIKMAEAIIEEARRRGSISTKRWQEKLIAKAKEGVAIKKTTLVDANIQMVEHKPIWHDHPEKPILKLRTQLNQIKLGLTDLGFDENASDEIIRTYLLTY